MTRRLSKNLQPSRHFFTHFTTARNETYIKPNHPWQRVLDGLQAVTSCDTPKSPNRDRNCSKYKGRNWKGLEKNIKGVIFPVAQFRPIIESEAFREIILCRIVRQVGHPCKVQEPTTNSFQITCNEEESPQILTPGLLQTPTVRTEMKRSLLILPTPGTQSRISEPQMHLREPMACDDSRSQPQLPPVKIKDGAF